MPGAVQYKDQEGDELPQYLLENFPSVSLDWDKQDTGMNAIEKEPKDPAWKPLFSG